MARLDLPPISDLTAALGSIDPFKTPPPRCVFCEIVAGREPADVVRSWPETIAIRPTNPVVPEHVLVIPRAHVPDAGVSAGVSAWTMARAAELADEHEAWNIITSRGRAASQSVFHLHLHVVPRTAGDNILLPWTRPHSERRTNVRR